MQVKTKIAVLILVSSFVSAFYFGQRGIDFGYHWDEHLHINLVKKYVETDKYLPVWHEYPSVLYDILLLNLLPELPKQQTASNPHDSSPREELLDDASFWRSFWTDSRLVFLFLTLLSSIWIFILILLWSKNPIEALVGSLLLLFSWETNYHARWIAPDGLMMSFGALSLLFMGAAITSKSHRKLFLRTAAVIAGIGLGTKYPGGILLLPLICASFLVKDRQSSKYAMLLEPVVLITIFSASFLLTTPGALAETPKFLSDIARMARIYGGGHFGYTVDSAVVHGGLILEYLALSAFSKYSAISITVFCFSCIGLVHLVRNEPKLAIWFLCLPVVYLLYFSLQKVMIVRNLLIVFPFIAVLASRGIFVSIRLLRYRPLKAVAGTGIVLALALNVAWLSFAAETIHGRKAINHRKNLFSYLIEHPQSSFYLTAGAQEILDLRESQRFSNIYENMEYPGFVIFLSGEGRKANRWIANRKGVYKVVSGPFEVNWDYYSS